MRTSDFAGRLGFIGVMVAGIVMLISAPAAGQGASIIGQVTDESGAVLPGVTVTATSPALQVQQVTEVTNERGEYRLTPLPIGVYEVSFELQGFRSARRTDIRLTVGFTARIDEAMGVGTLAETVNVSGTAPVVDVASTSGSTVLTSDSLSLTATARNGLVSVVNLAPGTRSVIEVGGNMIAEDPRSHSFGQGGSEWYTLDGVTTMTANRAFFDYNTLDEVRVQTLGTDAEQPTRGVQITAIVKSGGNDFHGGLSYSQTNQNFQGNNIDDGLREIGITAGDTLDTQFSVNGDLGGRIVRDKLWFYGAGSKRGTYYNVLQTFQPDGSPAQTLSRSRVFTGKVSFQANPRNRLIATMMTEEAYEEKGLNPLIAWESLENRITKRPIYKGEWQYVRSNWLTSAQVGYNNFNANNPFGVPITAGVGRIDLVTEHQTGENLVAGTHSNSPVLHTKASVTVFRPATSYGSHELKVGFEDMRQANNTGGAFPKVPNYVLQYEEGVPAQVVFFNFPTERNRDLNTRSLFVKDSWTVGRRLTVNPGIRFDSSTGRAAERCRDAAVFPSDVVFPAQCVPELRVHPKRTLSPRLHAAFDISGDAKTVVKGGFGQYHDLGVNVGRYDTAGTDTYAIFLWNDLNGNNDWDLGETNRDRFGPDFLEFTGGEFAASPARFVEPPGGEVYPYFNEFSFTLEHELMANFGLRFTTVFSQTKNVQRTLNRLVPYSAYNIPITNPDPGPDGQVGTGDDPGTTITYFDFDPALIGQVELESVTDTNANQSYRGFEVSGIKRLSNRWQVVASYSATKKNIPIGAPSRANATSFSGAGLQSAANGGFLNPNVEINSSDQTWEWDAKLSGTYIFPAGVLVSGNLHHQGGDAFARTVRVTGGEAVNALVVNATPIGAHRRPNVNLLTFRAEKSFALSSANAQRLAVRLNVYNALNVNTATSLQPRAGAEFLYPLAIVPPRLAELGLTYTF